MQKENEEPLPLKAEVIHEKYLPDYAVQYPYFF